MNVHENATVICNTTGKLIFAVSSLNQTSPVRSTNVGGLHDLYKTIDEYRRAFNKIVVSPSTHKIIERNGKITLQRNNGAFKVCIISGKYKK